ncbi:MAG: DNA repair protein RecO [Acidobacteria bacterium]|nr:DNA repair protein RecO [Acidobacteriota bacterium]
MGLIDTEALVLKSYNLSEADKIVVFLTREHGLIRGVAKGARRLKSRFGGSLEPFSIVQLTYFQKEERDLVSIRNSEIIRSFFESAADPDIFNKFAYIVELLNDFSPPEDPNERLYRMARICLETTAGEPARLTQLVLYFELWLLKLNGFLPAWENCEICKRPLADNEKTNLQANFQIVCRNCQKTRSNRQIEGEMREIYRAAQRVSPARFLELTAGRLAEVRELSEILKKLISNILGRETIGEKLLLSNK